MIQPGAGTVSSRPAVLLLQACQDVFENGLLVREDAGFELRVDQFVPNCHLEAPAAGGDEREALDLLLATGEQLGRQTDGLRLVSSHRAVFHFHVHDAPQSGRRDFHQNYTPVNRSRPGRRPGRLKVVGTRRVPLLYLCVKQRHTACAYYFSGLTKEASRPCCGGTAAAPRSARPSERPRR